MTLLEKFARRHARQISVDGALGLSTAGDPLLMEAFAELGWSDPHVDHAVAPEAAILEAPERAVMPKSRGRLG